MHISDSLSRQKFEADNVRGSSSAVDNAGVGRLLSFFAVFASVIILKESFNKKLSYRREKRVSCPRQGEGD